MPEFEDRWCQLRSGRVQGSLGYDGPSVAIREVVLSHFRRLGDVQQFGVYVIRSRDSGDVLYVGKAGTVTKDGGWFLWAFDRERRQGQQRRQSGRNTPDRRQRTARVPEPSPKGSRR